jgi:16S rRNA C967 or C1407 C5-methylase (RsmB/RsmF family)/NOL1/NOP2/fmu family ribosome biogenesis protein
MNPEKGNRDVGKADLRLFPEGFKKRVHTQKYIDSEALMKALMEPSPVSIKINKSKWNKKPLNAKAVLWSQTGFYLTNRPSFTLDPLFHSGCYYPQEASSMFLEQAIRQSIPSLNNIRALDLCGAPGGKSTILSDLIGPDSLLVTNEVIRSRSLILSEIITKWGLGNALVTQNDPAHFARLPGYFDVILVDAPCSGEGMFRNKVAIDEWSLENTNHCSERQKRILKNVWPALKENGILIYSTCTFNPGENEENIKWLLNNHEAECLKLNLSDYKGIVEIDYHGIYGYGFYPDKLTGEGFFISVIRKTGKQNNVRIRSQMKAELKPEKADLETVDRWTDFKKERLVKWNGELIAVPCDLTEYIHLFQNLKIVKPGTKIFVVKKNNYLPSHELALSIYLKNSAFPEKEIELREAISYMRRDTIMFNDISLGWNIITYKGVNLGFIKNIGKRANNYFPVEWRIRMRASEPEDDDIISWVKENSF